MRKEFMPQQQHRMDHRAPHGAPEFTERIAIYCTAKQKAKFKRCGGSQWLREVIDNAYKVGQQ